MSRGGAVRHSPAPRMTVSVHRDGRGSPVVYGSPHNDKDKNGEVWDVGVGRVNRT
jgi:hypothetical protein